MIGYAKGYQQGLESELNPKPCNGPKYDDWELGDFVMQLTQEFCNVRLWEAKKLVPQKWRQGGITCSKK